MATGNRLIDANALKSEFEWLLSVVNLCNKDKIRDTIERIEKAPTVDAVEVVRCNTAALNCMQGQIAQLMSLTKVVVPNSSICPGWGDVTVSVTPTTTGA